MKKEDQATDTNPGPLAEGPCSASLRSFDSNAESTKNENRAVPTSNGLQLTPSLKKAPAQSYNEIPGALSSLYSTYTGNFPHINAKKREVPEYDTYFSTVKGASHFGSRPGSV